MSLKSIFSRLKIYKVLLKSFYVHINQKEKRRFLEFYKVSQKNEQKEHKNACSKTERNNDFLFLFYSFLKNFAQLYLSLF